MEHIAIKLRTLSTPPAENIPPTRLKLFGVNGRTEMMYGGQLVWRVSKKRNSFCNFYRDTTRRYCEKRGQTSCVTKKVIAKGKRISQWEQRKSVLIVQCWRKLSQNWEHQTRTINSINYMYHISRGYWYFISHKTRTEKAWDFQETS